ncbi:MAG: TOBE domain-containing protein, partial [Paracoccus sp. (in: a-proteobacteria)]|nr:TOBE domain-containing protein [Paracoccus sp. (in: a-proteobacteria)]
PERLFAAPASVDVAQFLNIGTLSEGKAQGGQGFVCANDRLRLENLCHDVPDGPARILIPRTAIRPDPAGALTARVLRCQFQGDRYLLQLGLDDGGTALTCPAQQPMAVNSHIALSIDRDRLRVFPL